MRLQKEKRKKFLKSFVIGLIPARGGSKGVPGKNMRMIGSKPLISHSINAALQSNYINYVYVSSDDLGILRYARAMGVIGILRPDEFATDTASAVEVVEHFISTLPNELLDEDPYIIYLQPTSPLRNACHIDQAMEEMLKLNAKSLISVSKIDKSPFKMFFLDKFGRLQSLFDENLSNARRQDLPEVVIPNGAIYVFRVSEFKLRCGFPSNGSVPFLMSAKDSIDIDTEEDICRAEILLRGK